MPDIPLKKQFDSWCKAKGISPASHDRSIAEAAWCEACRLMWEAVEKAAKKGGKDAK